MKVFGWLGTAFLVIFSQSANIITILSGVDGAYLKWEQVLQNNYYNIVFFQTVCLIFLVFFLIFLYAYNRTTIIVFFKAIVYKPLILMQHIHAFEHDYEKYRQEIEQKEEALKDQRLTLDSIFVRERVYALLSLIRLTLEAIGFSAVNVNIKIPIKKYNEKNQSEKNQILTELIDVSNVLLKTYERASSSHETKLTTLNDIGKSKLNPRSDNEKFLVNQDCKNSDNIKWIKSNMDTCSKKHKCNSAYNYVLGQGENCWICNNLLEAEKNELYFSTSENWKSYYNALAVVAIAEHSLKIRGTVNNSFGILIADSKERNAFNKALVRQVLGYFAHKIFFLFSSIEIKH